MSILITRYKFLSFAMYLLLIMDYGFYHIFVSFLHVLV